VSSVESAASTGAGSRRRRSWCPGAPPSAAPSAPPTAPPSILSALPLHLCPHSTEMRLPMMLYINDDDDSSR